MAGHSLLCLPVFVFLMSIFSAFLFFFIYFTYLDSALALSFLSPLISFM